ncbi:MAG: hypothetical protein RRZ70_01385 [Synergistaceae bacterium]
MSFDSLFSLKVTVFSEVAIFWGVWVYLGEFIKKRLFFVLNIARKTIRILYNTKKERCFIKAQVITGVI